MSRMYSFLLEVPSFSFSLMILLSMRCHVVVDARGDVHWNFVFDAREDVHCVVDTAVRPLKDVQVAAGICLELFTFYVLTLHVEITSAGDCFIFFQNTIISSKHVSLNDI